jgi:hypothetical protein
MGELRHFDLDLDKSEPPAPPPSPPRWPVFAAGALVVLLLALAVFWWSRRSGSIPQQVDAPAQGRPAERPGTPVLGGPGEAIEIPPLEESDSLVRQLVSRLSEHPAVAAWLTTDGLIRNATVVVHNVAAGQTPAARLRRLAPQDAFTVSDEGRQTIVDSGSYARYDWLADGVASLDTDGTARLYGTLKPRVEEAYAELGAPEARFDATLERALIVLLETPVVEGDPALVTRGALYAYADPRLEGLSPAQKQLLRTGPRNTRLVQAKLREIALALGVPAERLPHPITIRAR